MVSLNEELIASYTVEITGIDRTRKQMAELDSLLTQLRAPSAGGLTSISIQSSQGGNGNVFTSAFENLTGHIQGAAEKIMLEAMDQGVEYQTTGLLTAVTPTGQSGRGRNGGGRNGPGRDDTGKLIDALRRNVETLRTGASTFITGWHGWSDSKPSYTDFQERGTKGRGGKSYARDRHEGNLHRIKNVPRTYAAGEKRGKGSGVPAANSLGFAIIPVREFLKRELGRLGK